jgi:hypothetical protein
MRKFIIAGLAIIAIATLCYAAVKVSVDVGSIVSDHAAWNVEGQEFTVYLAKGDSTLEALDIPGVDSAVTLLYIRSATSDAYGEPYDFRLVIGTRKPHSDADTNAVRSRTWELDRFLATDLSYRGGLSIKPDSIWISNPNPVAIKLSVYVAGIAK